MAHTRHTQHVNIPFVWSALIRMAGIELFDQMNPPPVTLSNLWGVLRRSLFTGRQYFLFDKHPTRPKHRPLPHTIGLIPHNIDLHNKISNTMGCRLPGGELQLDDKVFGGCWVGRDDHHHPRYVGSCYDCVGRDFIEARQRWYRHHSEAADLWQREIGKLEGNRTHCVQALQVRRNRGL